MTLDNQHAHRIKAARENCKFSVDETAAYIGLNISSYYDLEIVEGEIFNAVSLNAIIQLCSRLKISPTELFTGKSSAPEEKMSKTTLSQVASSISNYLLSEKISLEKLEKKVGWELKNILQNPNSALTDWCLDTLRDVCKPIGIEWLTVLETQFRCDY